MRYAYKFVDKEILLDEAEHRKVIEDMKKGKNIIVLRRGDLVLNMNLVATVSETHKAPELTREQEILALNAGVKKALLERPRMVQVPSQGLERAINPSDKVCASCNRLHYIPVGEYCLGCNHRTQKEIRLLKNHDKNN